MSRIAHKPRTRASAYPASRQPAGPPQNALERESEAIQTSRLAVCEWCGIEFKPKRKGQKYHSDKCRLDTWKKRAAAGKNTVSQDAAPVLGIVLVMNGTGERIPCGFCHRYNKVDLTRDGRQNAICRCGARYFCRVGRNGREQWGWKKGNQRSYFL